MFVEFCVDTVISPSLIGISKLCVSYSTQSLILEPFITSVSAAAEQEDSLPQAPASLMRP